MEATTEDMEMRERGEEEAAEEAAGREEETSFTDDRQRDDSILIIDGSNPVFTRVGNEEEIENTDQYIESRLKELKSDEGLRRYIIHNKKQFLKNGLGITVNKEDGPSSTSLFDRLRTTTSEKTNKINGVKYRGKKILFLKGDKMEYSTNKVNKPYVDEFKDLLKKADKEHQKTPAALAEKRTGVDITQDTMNDIINNVSEKIDTKIDNIVDDIKANTEIATNELRELRGMLDPKGETPEKKLEALKVEIKHWREEAEKEGETSKGKLYETIAKVGELKADEIRLRLNTKPVSEEVTTMVEEEAEVNDLTRFERFKKWSRENLLSLSATAISIAGIITTIIMAGRNALKRGVKGLGKLGKALANLAGKVGPVLAGLLNIAVKLLSLGVKGLSFLAQNLWILVLALTYFVYNEYTRSRKQQ